MRLRRRLAGLVPVVVALGAGIGSAEGARATEPEPSGHEDPLGHVVDLDALTDPSTIEAGRALFRTGCVSCHGAEGVGTPTGPPLYDAGAASAHFYLTTGRMPHTGGPEDQAVRKAPAYSPEEIEGLVAYVASLGDGPPIPEVDPGANLQEGGDLFRAQCAACHSASGAGGALSFGQNAPSLDEATPVQIYEAMLIGPGQMPTFGTGVFTEEEMNGIVAYVRRLRDIGDPGGLSLGRVGPIPEGFVAIVIGTGATMLAAFLIGRRVHDDDSPEPRPDHEEVR